MAFSSLSAFSYFVYPFIDRLFNKIGGIFVKWWEVKWVGPVTVSGIVSVVISIGVVAAWLATFYWILTDLLAISLALTALSFVRLPNLKISSIILILFFVYDVFWVFISPFIFKKSVMESVATQLPTLPMVLIFPRVLSPGFSLLGLGDIVLPGLWLCFLFRFDKANRTEFKHGYFLRSWIGYILGIILTLIMVVVLQRGQPALLYLVPFTLIPAVVLGWMRGELKHLWNGTTTHQMYTVEEGRAARGSTEDSIALLGGDIKSV